MLKKCFGPKHKGQEIDLALFTGPNNKACKECARVYAQIYYAKNKEILKAKCKEWKRANKDLNQAYGKVYRKENKQEILEYKAKYLTSIENKIWVRATKRISKELLFQSIKPCDRLAHLIGCNKHELYEHLKARFRPGMGASNYGANRLQWQMDHIKPLASFDFHKESEQRVAFHYTNIQPLWSTENQRKADRLNFKLPKDAEHTEPKTPDEDRLRLAS